MHKCIEDRESLAASWEEICQACSIESPFDLATFKHLVFDTYWYFKRSEQFNSVLREDLPIYRLIYLLWGDENMPYIEGYEHYVTYCCLDVARGLTHSIDHSFKRGRYKVMLPVGFRYCDAPEELDMSSYESYERCFRKRLIYFMRTQIEDEEDGVDGEPLDEEEELRKIAATKDA